MVNIIVKLLQFCFIASNLLGVTCASGLSKIDAPSLKINKQTNEVEDPEDLALLNSQSGGHIGILKDNKGRIFKPLKDEPELKFYEMMSVSNDPVCIQLKKFVPEYYGTKYIRFDGTAKRFMVLEDVTKNFLKPCTMDIKLGLHTWVPGATIKKRIKSQLHSGISKIQINFSLIGVSVYDLNDGNYYKLGKSYGVKANRNDVMSGIMLFLNRNHLAMSYLLPLFINKLKEILDWWKFQRRFHIYSSSILLAYDASVLEEIMAHESHDDSTTLDYSEMFGYDSWLRVKMIDFAHVLPAEKNRPDLNYISGLTKLIFILEKMYETIMPYYNM